MPEPWGPWTVGRTLGVGGLAVVTAAQAIGDDGQGLGPEIALKRLHPHLVDDPALRDLFVIEQSVACDVTPHPHLATGLARGEHDGTPYLALTLAPGRDLRKSIVREWASARTILFDACDALIHLHQQGILHGDVNPANLVVDDEGRAVLCDLGVTRQVGHGGPVRGTHAYMAPEQVRGELWTPATDVFALGIVMWELASGTRLFAREQSFLTMTAVVEDPVPDLDNHFLNELAKLALDKNPATRLSTVAELRARLLDA